MKTIKANSHQLLAENGMQGARSEEHGDFGFFCYLRLYKQIWPE